MKTSETINEIATALSKAQGAMGHAAKDSSNPFFNSKYADLASVIDASREALSANGLSISQGSHSSDGAKWVLITKLSHSSGQWYESETPIITSKNDAQGFGSGMTYARRYGMSAMIGLTQDDDDANEAVKPVQPKAPNKPMVESKPPVQTKTPLTPPNPTTVQTNHNLTPAQVNRLNVKASTAGIPANRIVETVKARFNCLPSEMRKMDYDSLCDELDRSVMPSNTGGSSK